MLCMKEEKNLTDPHPSTKAPLVTKNDLKPTALPPVTLTVSWTDIISNSFKYTSLKKAAPFFSLALLKFKVPILNSHLNKERWRKKQGHTCLDLLTHHQPNFQIFFLSKPETTQSTPSGLEVVLHFYQPEAFVVCKNLLISAAEYRFCCSWFRNKSPSDAILLTPALFPLLAFKALVLLC